MTEILSLIEEDSKFKQEDLDKMSVKIPYLHSVWYSRMIEELKILRGIDMSLKTMKRDKFLYYSGRGSDEEYREKPLDHKILKSDIDIFMDADEEYQKLQSKHFIQKAKVDAIEAFIKQLNQLSFNIRNAVEFMKFKSGLN